MSDIPSEVFREILLRLAAVSLFRFRIVSKTWLSIIEDPSFIKAHANNQLCSHALLVRNETGAPLYSFSLNFIKGPQKIEATRIKQLIRPGVPRLQDLYRVSSCNGLLLISHENIKKIWAIWNPLTGDCHELPKLDNASLKLDGFGFGYDYDADDYKVVRIDKVLSEDKVMFQFQTYVYSLKLGLWRVIEGCPIHRLLFNPGAFLNGTLYWRSWDSIIAFNLRTETFCESPQPSEVDGMHTSFHLDALDGCLIFSMYYEYQFDGWMMKDNGVEKSWIKLFSISCSLSDASWRFKIVAYLKSKRQIVVQDYCTFLWFDIGNNSVLKFSVHGFPYINSSQICSGSLVRLNACGITIGLGAATATKTSTKKRKRNSEKTDSRLKICVEMLKTSVVQITTSVVNTCAVIVLLRKNDIGSLLCRHSSLGEERYWET